MPGKDHSVSRIRRTRRVVAVLVLAVSPLVLSACGSSSGNSNTTTTHVPGY